MHGQKNIIAESMYIIIFSWQSIIFLVTWVPFSFFEVPKFVLLPHSVPLSAQREGIISSKFLAWKQLYFNISCGHFASTHLQYLI